MPTAPHIRWSTPADRDAILAFIAEMGFTPRDATTWDGLAMRAVCAWRGEALVGVMPIEPRPFRVSATETVLAAHLTCVAVHPDERGGGVGSAKQDFLFADPPEGMRLLTVYREEPDSPGYRWYRKNGFTPANHIVSWTRELSPAGGISVDLPWDLAACRQLWAASRSGGVVDQRERPLDTWLAVHPYRRRYAFDVIQRERGYAVVGVGQLHSASPRLDVLDLIAFDVVAAKEVLEACLGHAQRRGITTIRFALAQRDPIAAVAVELGMSPGWNFDLLVRPIGKAIDPREWRYASIDFA